MLPLRVNRWAQRAHCSSKEAVSNVSAPSSPILLPEASSLGWRTGLSEEFKKKKVIGSGALGQVCIGINLKSGQEVAIKTMPKARGKLLLADVLGRVALEAAMLQRMQDYPGAVRLLACFEDRDSVQIVMEVLHGGDLKKYVEENGPLEEEALRVVASRVLGFLAACHSRGIFYGDVKPANFCLVEDGPLSLSSPSLCLKSVDFGSSQELSGDQRLSKRAGTLVFMAPEVYGQDYGPKAEVWSLGVCLYWLFSQRLPFWESGQEPVLVFLMFMAEAISNAPIRFDYDPWLSMSPEGLDFLRRCLTREEGARLSVDEALQHPWLGRLAL